MSLDSTQRDKWHRVGYSDADMAARKWLEGQMKEIGMKTWCDGVGNYGGRYVQRRGACVMAGSYLFYSTTSATE